MVKFTGLGSVVRAYRQALDVLGYRHALEKAQLSHCCTTDVSSCWPVIELYNIQIKALLELFFIFLMFCIELLLSLSQMFFKN